MKVVTVANIQEAVKEFMSKEEGMFCCFNKNKICIFASFGKDQVLQCLIGNAGHIEDGYIFSPILCYENRFTILKSRAAVKIAEKKHLAVTEKGVVGEIFTRKEHRVIEPYNMVVDDQISDFIRGIIFNTGIKPTRTSHSLFCFSPSSAMLEESPMQRTLRAIGINPADLFLGFSIPLMAEEMEDSFVLGTTFILHGKPTVKGVIKKARKKTRTNMLFGLLGLTVVSLYLNNSKLLKSHTSEFIIIVILYFSTMLILKSINRKERIVEKEAIKELGL